MSSDGTVTKVLMMMMMMCFRHSSAPVLQHAAVLLGFAVSFARLSDGLSQESLRGTYRHLDRSAHRALHAHSTGQTGIQSNCFLWKMSSRRSDPVVLFTQVLVLLSLVVK